MPCPYKNVSSIRNRGYTLKRKQLFSPHHIPRDFSTDYAQNLSSFPPDDSILVSLYLNVFKAVLLTLGVTLIFFCQITQGRPLFLADLSPIIIRATLSQN